MEASSDPRGDVVPWHTGRLHVPWGHYRLIGLNVALIWICVGFAGGGAGPILWPMAGILLAAVLVVPFTRKELWMRERRRLARTPVGILTPWRLDEPPWIDEKKPVRLTASLPLARPLGGALLGAGALWYALNITKAWSTEWGLGLALVSWAAGSLLINSRGTARTSLVRPSSPFRVGERAELTFYFDKVRRSPAVFDRLTFTLRCLTETRRWCGLVRPEVRCLRSAQIEHGDDLPPTPIAVDLAFDLPADAPGTEVLADPAVFWDLLVEGDGEGFRYRQEFLVPVYGAVEGPGL